MTETLCKSSGAVFLRANVTYSKERGPVVSDFGLIVREKRMTNQFFSVSLDELTIISDLTLSLKVEAQSRYEALKPLLK